jgi:hypothetical protein
MAVSACGEIFPDGGGQMNRIPLPKPMKCSVCGGAIHGEHYVSGRTRNYDGLGQRIVYIRLADGDNAHAPMSMTAGKLKWSRTCRKCLINGIVFKL